MIGMLEMALAVFPLLVNNDFCPTPLVLAEFCREFDWEWFGDVDVDDDADPNGDVDDVLGAEMVVEEAEAFPVEEDNEVPNPIGKIGWKLVLLLVLLLLVVLPCWNELDVGKKLGFNSNELLVLVLALLLVLEL